MKNNYYSEKGLWKGNTAIGKLATEAGVREENARRFLEKQALWQIYLPAPKYVPRPHLTTNVPNQVHQAHLLFLPHDRHGKKVFYYALVMVDVASRLKDAEPLTGKSSEEVAKAFAKIYSRQLKWPETLIFDPGSEFKVSVTQ